MRKSQHGEAEIIAALKQVEAGRKVEDVAREYRVSKSHFRPLGSHKPAQPVLSRRAFLGASVAVPAALALDGKAWAAGQLEDTYDVRFVEDAQGMSVITAQDKVWRLHRLAF